MLLWLFSVHSSNFIRVCSNQDVVSVSSWSSQPLHFIVRMVTRQGYCQWIHCICPCHLIITQCNSRSLHQNLQTINIFTRILQLMHVVTSTKPEYFISPNIVLLHCLSFTDVSKSCSIEHQQLTSGIYVPSVKVVNQSYNFLSSRIPPH